MSDIRKYTDSEVKEIRDSHWIKNDDGTFEFVGGDTFVVPTHRMYDLAKKFKRFDGRAKKIGMNAPTYTVLGEWDEKVQIDPYVADDFIIRHWTVVKVEGAEPVLAGYTFKATLDHTVFDDFVHVRTVPGATIPEHFYNQGNDGHCDHCNRTRTRNETFVVYNEQEDRFMKVGRQCLKDFLGGQSPTSVVNMMAFWKELAGSDRDPDSDFGYGGWSKTESGWTLASFLAWTSSVIRHDGWMSRSNAWGREDISSTADQVIYLLVPPTPMGRDAGRIMREWEEAREKYMPTDVDREIGHAATEWAADLEPKGEYLFNIHAIAKTGNVKFKTVGHAASIIPAYNRHIEAEMKRKEINSIKKNVHFGTPKDRVDATVKVNRKAPFSSMYGGGVRVEMTELETGASLTWFANGSVEDFLENAKYKVKLTVKSHGEYNDWKQTVVTRVKMVEEVQGE